jgi:cytidyltransferase-like protein
MPRSVAVSGAFDEPRSKDIRFLEEASRLGELTVYVWSDERVHIELGTGPRFPEAERLYFLNAIRYVSAAKLLGSETSEAALLLSPASRPDFWAVRETRDAHNLRLCESAGVECRVIDETRLQGWPYSPATAPPGGRARKKVIVTGCYDWFHSGHIRFFEEVSAFGDLYVVLGHDANIRLLKGQGHPMFSQEERRYMVGSVRYVKEALISTGHGWLDAEPEIARLKPDIYAVNEDGDRGGKREFCDQHGIEYLVLKRTPAPGLPSRTSTSLRGF